MHKRSQSSKTEVADMKYTVLDIDFKQRRVRLGASLVWAVALIVLAWIGHKV